jgi:hypothetical protein
MSIQPAESGTNPPVNAETVAVPNGQPAAAELGTGDGTGDDGVREIVAKTGSSETKAYSARSPRQGPFSRFFRTSTSGADDCGVTEEALRIFRTRVRSNDDVTNEVAEELSAALRQAERIRALNLYIPGAADQLNFIVECLLAPKPLLILARDERLNLQVEIYRHAGRISRTLAAISSGSQVGLVLTALGISFVLWTLIMVLLQAINSLSQKVGIIPSGFFFMDARALGIITFAALIGGIVSIATRLNDFSRVRDLDPFAMFWTAMLKPLIGVVLAVFILATLEGRVISFGFLGSDLLEAISAKTTPDGDGGSRATQALYILWMLGFLAGFSERFAWDFVDRAEGAASGSPGGQPSNGKKQ